MFIRHQLTHWLAFLVASHSFIFFRVNKRILYSHDKIVAQLHFSFFVFQQAYFILTWPRGGAITLSIFTYSSYLNHFMCSHIKNCVFHFSPS